RGDSRWSAVRNHSRGGGSATREALPDLVSVARKGCARLRQARPSLKGTQMTDLANVNPESRAETLMATPDKVARVRDLFGVDSDMEVPAFSAADQRVRHTAP